MALLVASNIKSELTSLASDDTTYDTLLGILATAIQDLWKELTGEGESAEYTEYYDSDRENSIIILRHRPVIGDIILYDDPNWEWDDSDLIDSDDYVVDREAGIVHYGGTFFHGKQNLKVTYTSGYTTGTLPSIIKEIWTRQACEWFTQARNKTWAVSNVSQGEGSISIDRLKDNLLPEFVLLARLHGGNV